MELPPKLYKYLTPERIDVLVNKKIRFTQACLLNDPFEFSPGMPIAEDEQGLGPFEQREAARRSVDFRAKSRSFGVLCLTKTRESIPMWTHYAAGHQGFVIGFDTCSTFFAKAWNEGRLAGVRYQPMRPCVTRDCPSDKVLFRTKSTSWTAEDEWRWIECRDPQEYAEVTTDGAGNLVFLRSIPPTSICEVILGCRAGQNLETSMRTLASTEEYRHVKLLNAVLDQSCYDLRIQEM